MIDFLKRIFIWWDGRTLGTGLTMWQRGAKLVGTDSQGNRYFEEGGKPSHPEGHGRRRRWVVYHGVAEGSRVEPEWHGWLHHIFDEPPSVAALPKKKFETPYLPNMTGTPLAYRPKGSLSRGQAGAQAVDQGYEAWSPEDA